MSAYFSVARPDGVALFTDGAAALDGILAADVRKVVTGDRVAVTGRGPSEVVMKVAESFCAWANEVGPEAAIAGAQRFAATVWDELAGDRRGFDILIAAYLPAIGGVHRYFQSTPTTIRQTGEAVGAFQVIDPGVVVNSIGRLSADQAALFRPRADDTLEACARREGLAAMNWMREIPAQADGVATWAIGGHVDITLITAGGATVEKVHDWPDEIGQPIQPFATRADRRRAMRAAG